MPFGRVLDLRTMTMLLWVDWAGLHGNRHRWPPTSMFLQTLRGFKTKTSAIMDESELEVERADVRQLSWLASIKFIRLQDDSLPAHVFGRHSPKKKKKSTFTTGTSEKRHSAAHPKASLVTHSAPDTQLNCLLSSFKVLMLDKDSILNRSSNR